MMDALVTLFITIITAVIVYVGSEIRKNERARTIFNVLEPLAKDAVVAAFIPQLFCKRCRLRPPCRAMLLPETVILLICFLHHGI